MGQQLVDGIISGLDSKMSELKSYCERITETITDSLRIDPSALVESSRDMMTSIQAALPSLENNIRYVASSAPVAVGATSHTTQAPIHLNFGDVYVREESDLDKLANKVLRKLGKEVNYSGLVRGVRAF